MDTRRVPEETLEETVERLLVYEPEAPFEGSCEETTMGGPPWHTDPMTLEEEASVGYQPEESEACEPEKLVEEETAQLEWWKTSEWDHVDECLWAAIGGIIGEFEDRMGIHEADWVTTIRLNGSLLDSIVEEIAQYVVDYYTSPLDAHFLPEYEDSPEFQELERVLDEEISFDEGYKRFIESDFAERLACGAS